MPGARWFPGAHLNWAEHCLRLAGRLGTDTVLVARSQTRDRMSLTADELRAEVGRVRCGAPTPRRRTRRPRRRLPPERAGGGGRAARDGLARRDLGELPARIRRAVRRGPVSARSIRRCSSRSTAIANGGREIDRTADVAAIRAALPSLTATVALPYLDADASRITNATGLGRAGLRRRRAAFEPVPFDHPFVPASTRPARPGCRSRSCTPMAASSSST
jgi:acetoacetyl-CoA synthetase